MKAARQGQARGGGGVRYCAHGRSSRWEFKVCGGGGGNLHYLDVLKWHTHQPARNSSDGKLFTTNFSLLKGVDKFPRLGRFHVAGEAVLPQEVQAHLLPPINSGSRTSKYQTE